MGSDLLSGLNEGEAARRLQDIGPNELSVGQGRSLVRIVGETLREPMFLLLLRAALLHLR
jgi:Ca2+-transporting ATPase